VLVIRKLLQFFCYISILSGFLVFTAKAAKLEQIVIALPNTDCVQFVGYDVALTALFQHSPSALISIKSDAINRLQVFIPLDYGIYFA